MLILFQTIVAIVFLVIALTLILDEKKGQRLKRQLVEVKTLWAGKNRRKFVRYSSVLDVDYKVSNGVKSKISKSRDISSHGIGLVLDQKLRKRTVLELNIKVQEVSEPIHAKAQVMWSVESDVKDLVNVDKRFFYTGIKFIGFRSNKHKQHLYNYLESCSEHVSL